MSKKAARQTQLRHTASRYDLTDDDREHGPQTISQGKDLRCHYIMVTLWCVVMLFVSAFAKAQTPNKILNNVAYTHEPAVLEGYETNLTIALSLQKLFIDYDGPLVRLRRQYRNGTCGRRRV